MLIVYAIIDKCGNFMTKPHGYIAKQLNVSCLYGTKQQADKRCELFNRIKKDCQSKVIELEIKEIQ